MTRANNGLGMLDQQIMLAVLKLRPTAYGVAIQDHIEACVRRSYSIGAIYAALDRLEQKGYIAVRRGEPTAERGGRAKLYVDLTATGQHALKEALGALDALRKDVRWEGVFA